MSGFEWNALFNAPHRLVRHPDMPRAVYCLMWEALKRNEFVGAYVKNRSESGGCYWVFAVITPTRDGYLSVQIKPSSALFAKVKEAYAELQAAEVRENLAPEKSAERLKAVIKSLGYRDFHTFCVAALAEEAAARGVQLGQRPDPRVPAMASILKSASQIGDEAVAMIKAFDVVKLTPINMHIQSSRLGDAAAAIKTISENYRLLASTIEETLAGVTKTVDKVLASAQMGLAETCISNIQREVATAFEKDEALPPQIRKDHETAILRNQAEMFSNQMDEALLKVRSEARRMVAACSDMRAILLGLGMTGSLCRLEGARLYQKDSKLSDIVSDLEVFQKGVGEGLEVIERQARSILNSLKVESAAA